MFKSIDEVIDRFAKLQYITGRTIATVVYLAAEMKKPILVEGPAGGGKTEHATGRAGPFGQGWTRCHGYGGLARPKAPTKWVNANTPPQTQFLKARITR